MAKTLLKIAQRIAAGYVFLLLLILGMGAVGSDSLEQVVDAIADLYGHPFTVTNSLSDLRRSVLGVNSEILRILAYPAESASGDWKPSILAAEADAQASIALVRDRYMGDPADINQLDRAWSDWQDMADMVVEAINQGDSDYARDIYRASAEPQYHRVLAATDTILHFARTHANRLHDSALRAKDRQRLKLLLLLGGALSVGVMVMGLVSRSILRPLDHLRGSLRSVTQGHLDYEVAETARADEIGEMARELEALRLELLEKRRTEMKFATVFSNCPDIILISEKSTGKFLQVNEAFQRVLGFTEAEAVGHSSLEIHFWGEPDDRASMIAALENGDRLTGYEAVLRRKDGARLTALLSVEEVELDGVQCLIAVARDITERKQEEETLRKMVAELERTNAELNRFAHVAAHDLQEPCRRVVSYVQLLEREFGPQLQGDGSLYLGFITAGATRMRELVRGMVDYSRTGTLASSFTDLSLDKIVADVLADLRPSIEAKKAEVTLPADLPKVRGDSEQLHQLFTQLIGNALKFQPSGQAPVVRLTARRESDKLHLILRDNGIGIPDSHAKQVFEMFRRLHGQHQYPGAGVGLSLCKRVVEAHGGEIWLASPDGGGTEMHFTLAVA